MTFKEILESNPFISLASTAVASFVAGWGAHVVLLAQTNQEVVVKGTYVLKEEIESGESKLYIGRAAADRQIGRGKLIHCYESPDYPKGKWWVAGKTLEYDRKVMPAGTAPGLAYYVTFASSTSGVTKSDEPGSADANFTVIGKIWPGESIRTQYIDATSTDRVPYESTTNLRISDDGCSMSGTWSDNYNVVHPGQVRQSGEQTLIWAEPHLHWIQAKSTE
jgi:hypothetical protein